MNEVQNVLSNTKQKGFTIVELLIVVVIIGILAAIVVVAYNGVTNSARDTAVKSDLANFGKKIEIVRAQEGAYPATLTSAMGFAFSKEMYELDSQGRTLRYCRNSATDQYILYARSKSGSYFKVTPAGVTDATSAYGYNICSQIGLTSTNPSADGLNGTTWASWAN